MAPLRSIARCHPRLKSEKGAELVELALVTPVLLLMLAGLFDIGFLLNHHTVVTNAAREGARVAAIPGWTEGDVQARVNAYLAAGGLPVAGVVTTVDPVYVTAGTQAFNAVRVVVEYPYDYLLLDTIAGWFSEEVVDATVTAAATMRSEVAAGS